ncbi:hypothetical protein QK290_02205 [Pseudarthrobacter sp. AL07]|nr:MULTISPECIES: hypothetical protein [unclassified Pseudarthrobacter]MDI3193291.1 hypothetical protein [Pseudarthrobacter sp. AL20]MDI3207359.1 hypothetical protein [Pseudarthrobacter sp. AL07]
MSDSGDVYAASLFGNEIVKIDAWTREASQFLLWTVLRPSN